MSPVPLRTTVDSVSFLFVRARADMPVVPVAARATTRRDWVVSPPERAIDAVPVAARAVVVPGRWVTRRVDDVATPPVRADVPVVAARAPGADVVGVRATTLRVAVFVAARVRTNVFIGALDCDGLVPGFNWVRMVLFIYGYRLLYVFALT